MRLRPILLALSLTALLTAFGLAGCDPVAEIIGVDEFDVALGDDAVLPLLPNTAVSAGSDATIDANLPDVFDIQSISIPDDAVTFTPALPGSGGGVCTVRLYAMVDRVPALQATIRLEDGSDVVKNVTSRYAEPYNRDRICEDLGGSCPVTQEDLTEADIRDRVDAAVDRRSFALDLVADNDGPCAGVLRIERLHFELDF
jgi:hypothetical protein